jgi:hypothetical protein
MADELRDQKREQMLWVAEALFPGCGYAQTTVADIVETPGVTKPFCIAASTARTTSSSSCAGALRCPIASGMAHMDGTRFPPGKAAGKPC